MTMITMVKAVQLQDPRRIKITMQSRVKEVTTRVRALKIKSERMHERTMLMVRTLQSVIKRVLLGADKQPVELSSREPKRGRRMTRRMMLIKKRTTRRLMRMELGRRITGSQQTRKLRKTFALLLRCSRCLIQIYKLNWRDARDSSKRYTTVLSSINI